jgi:hypothetical protein
MRHSVKTEILQSVLNYLANRPYHEVASIITSIQGDATVIEGTKDSELNSVESLVSNDKAAS